MLKLLTCKQRNVRYPVHLPPGADSSCGHLHCMTTSPGHNHFSISSSEKFCSTASREAAEEAGSERLGHAALFRSPTRFQARYSLHDRDSCGQRGEPCSHVDCCGAGSGARRWDRQPPDCRWQAPAARCARAQPTLHPVQPAPVLDQAAAWFFHISVCQHLDPGALLCCRQRRQHHPDRHLRFDSQRHPKR